MATPDLSKPVRLIDWLEKRIYLAWLVFVISGLVVALAEYFTPKDTDQEAVVILFGILFVISAVILSFSFGDKEHGKLVRLRRLAQDEYLVMQRFIKENSATLNFQAFEHGIWSLAEKRILTVYDHLTPDAGDGGVLVCGIKPWAFRYLNRHRELVGLPSMQSIAGK